MMSTYNKIIDEQKQGEAFSLPENAINNHISRKLYLESYGCQMNFSDSEIVASIMTNCGFTTVNDYNNADVVFINTCSIRDKAEQTVRNRLFEFKKAKQHKPGMIIGILGCMAERLKSKLLEEEKLVDIVAGPDSYRDLPGLIQQVDSGQKAVNVLLSREETYADISPVRLMTNGVTAFISIMRGCDNMCSFCVVPFTRGRERSRNAYSIITEARSLFDNGYREITLLGQNVDSYKWESENGQEKINFAQLLELAASINPALRIRFSTSHPKDITDEVLTTMAKFDNICKCIHLPLQSGSSRILKLMNRTYDSSWYKDRVNAIHKIIPGCGITTDIITGFCTETEDDHKETLNMMQWVKYDFAYMFKYSERPGTLAARKYKDDVPDETKTRRLNEIIELQQKLSYQNNLKDVNKTHSVLVESISKRSDQNLTGRNSQNKVVIFPKKTYKKGDYVDVLVTSCTSATLLCMNS